MSKQIWTTAWPAVLEMVLYMMIGVADVAFVGRLGGSPLAGVALGAEIFYGVLLTLNALGTGATVLAAQYTGAGKRDRVDDVASATFVLSMLIGLVVGIIGYAGSPFIISLFNVEEEVARVAIGYMQIGFAVSPMALCLFMGNGVFRGTGMTRVPMTIALLSNVVNIIGIYVLVFGNWGFPQMGGLGSAVANATANSFGFVLFLIAMISGKWRVRLDLRRLLRPALRMYIRIIRLGLPSSVEEALREFNVIASSFVLVNLGTQAFAAHQIAITVESLSFMPGFGFAIAATAIVGQKLGACNVPEAKMAANRALLFAFILMGAAGAGFILAPQFIASLFTGAFLLYRWHQLPYSLRVSNSLASRRSLSLPAPLEGLEIPDRL